MNLKILVVEDNPSSLKLVADVLESADMEVSRAVSAEDALTILQNQMVDLILTDIMLPGIDGLSLTRKLKSTPRTANIPIVAMTANLVCDQRLAQDAGCEKLLSKPLDTRSLPQQLWDIIHCAIALQNTIEKKPQPCFQRDPSLPPLHVLIVEDDLSSLKLTSAVLMMSGYIVSVAGSAHHAARSVNVNPPDAIVLDLHLPLVDGLDLIRALKAEPSSANIPILAVTAFTLEYDRTRAFAAGCDGYLPKPIDTRALPRQLGDLLAAKGRQC